MPSTQVKFKDMVPGEPGSSTIPEGAKAVLGRVGAAGTVLSGKAGDALAVSASAVAAYHQSSGTLHVAAARAGLRVEVHHPSPRGGEGAVNVFAGDLEIHVGIGVDGAEDAISAILGILVP